MTKERLDVALVKRKLVASRSQAESFIKLGKVMVDGKVATKTGSFVGDDVEIVLTVKNQYVSRAGLKLESVAKLLGLRFFNKTVLDVGSSTGGFTDYAIRNGAQKIYAVDVGTEQLHPSLRQNSKIELHEKTDIRDFYMEIKPDIVLIDVSFISLREILPHIAKNLSGENTQIVAMVKPQFEVLAEINQSKHTERSRNTLHRGVIKNDSDRRRILRDFEDWSKQSFVIKSKRDSDIAGAKGNQERFYLLTLKRNSTISPGRIM